MTKKIVINKEKESRKIINELGDIFPNYLVLATEVEVEYEKNGPTIFASNGDLQTITFLLFEMMSQDENFKNCVELANEYYQKQYGNSKS